MVKKFSPVMTAPDGVMVPNLGRYHRQVVSIVFEMNGGVEWLADWAKNNETDFFTKLYPKLIPKEVEVQAAETVDDLLLKLAKERDKRMIDITPKEVPNADGRREERVSVEAEAAGSEDW